MQSEIQAIKQLFFSQDQTNKELAKQLLHSQNISEADFFQQTGLAGLGFGSFRQAERLFYSSLDLSNRQKCPDLSVLQGLSYDTLYLAGNEISDLGFLTHISGLKRLDISSNMVENLSPLAHFPRLKQLNCNYNRIAELAPLQDCPNLEDLLLYRNPVGDVSPLCANQNLEKLVISHCYGLKITSLEGLNIKELHCSYLRGVDCSQFPHLAQLEDLYLVDNALENMDFLGDYTQLRLLDISINPIQKLDFLQNLQQLEYLHCGNCGLESFAPLRAANIKGIFANKNPIKDLSPLSDMPELCVLHLNDSQIDDLSPLFGLKKLHSLHCNRLSPAQIAQMREKMPNCSLI